MIEPIVAEHPVRVEASHPAIWTGFYTGALLTIVMLGALVAANRIPGLEKYALERNGASYSLFALFMMVPVLRFLKRPLQLFGSAMIGWVIFTLAYDFTGMYFPNLFQVLRTPFQLLIEGAIFYGVCAVGSWVGEMALHARHHVIAPRRRRRSDSYTDHRS
jgi:hypothetical protein